MRIVLRTLLLASFASIIGVFAARTFLERQHSARSGIHAIIHEEIELDAGQKQKLVEIERVFGPRRAAIVAELRSENALLAAAIAAEKRAGPRVNAAVDRSHEALGRLQKETLAYVFALRQLLRPDQAPRFDQAVVKALTEDQREP